MILVLGILLAASSSITFIRRRNPARPSGNPSFTGPVILGGPNLYFSPDAFMQLCLEPTATSAAMFSEGRDWSRQICLWRKTFRFQSG